MTPDTSGPGSPVPFASFDPASSSWRTSQLTFDSDSTLSCETLPRRGSMRNGRLFALPMWVRATGGTDCSLLPTPCAQEDGRTPERHAEMKRNMGRRTVSSLSVMVKQAVPAGRMSNKLLPAPTSGDSKWGATGGSSVKYNTTLTDAVRLLPTPVARDHKGAALASRRGGPAWPGIIEEWAEYAPAINRHAAIVGRPPPSPVDDEGRLNAAFVEWMMMFPEGWVDGVSRSGQLRLLGNAVVALQAAAAWAHLLGSDLGHGSGGHHRLLPTPRALDANGAGKHGTGGPDLRTVLTCI